MEFRLLGPLEVRDSAGELPLGSGKQRALLAILLLEANRVVPSERLVDLLWGGQPPGSAAHGLQVQVSKLRKALGRSGEHRLLTRAPGYLLWVEPGELDADLFEQMITEGRERLRDGDPGAAARVLREAIGLWRGPALADVASERFAHAPIARLEDLRLSALEERLAADLGLGCGPEVVGELESLVAAEPLRERLRGQLMLALYQTGRQADALAAYRAGRQALVEELGLEPGRELQELHQAILRQDPALDPPGLVDATPASRGRTPDELGSGVVAIMFTDVAGSTAMTNRLGDAAARRILDRHKTLVRETVAEHGGREVDSVGDEFMMTFASTRRAVTCAVAVQRAFSNARRERPAEEVRVRIGLNAGEVLHGSGRPFGAAISAAKRVVDCAKGGEILVSEAVRHLAGTVPGTGFRDRGRFRLKGFEERWRLYEVVWRTIDERGVEWPPEAKTVERSRTKALLATGGARLLVFAAAVLILLGIGGGGLDRAGSLVRGGVGGSLDITAANGQLIADVEGTAAADVIRGTPASDVVEGLAGDDRLLGGPADDRISGGAGNDLIYGQAGDDRLYGGRGNDRIYGGPGSDVISCGPGLDVYVADTNDIVGDDCESGGKSHVVDTPEGLGPSPAVPLAPPGRYGDRDVVLEVRKGGASRLLIAFEARCKPRANYRNSLEASDPLPIPPRRTFAVETATADHTTSLSLSGTLSETGKVSGTYRVRTVVLRSDRRYDCDSGTVDWSIALPVNPSRITNALGTPRVTAPPAEYGVAARPTVRRSGDRYTARFSFNSLPTPRARLRVVWLFSDAAIVVVRKPRARTVTTFVEARHGALPGGDYRCVLEVRVPGGQWRPVKELRLRIASAPSASRNVAVGTPVATS
jgi:DNA-binding SARP family transcriptional activator